MTPVLTWPVGATMADRSGASIPPGYQLGGKFRHRLTWTVKGKSYSGIHAGLDLDTEYGPSCGIPVYAVAPGTVVVSKRFGSGWGNIVLIRHELPGYGTIWSQYAHLEKRTVKWGQVVAQHQQIGTIGDAEGQQGSCHLHFELRRSNLEADAAPHLMRPESAAMAYIGTHYINPFGRLGT